MADLVGRTLGPYTLESKLGKGGMASVYRAFQTSVKRYVAIKVMAPEIADQPGFIERFEREAELIAKLEHPHILPVIDYGTAEGLHYLVMRYIEGGSLEDRMRRAPLTLPEASHFLTQIASALDYAHNQGVIHRDLKPNNVLLDKTNNAYLTDFGIARLAQSEQRLTATGSVLGTPAYMSPEQGMGSPVDARSDNYTLGVVLYEMVLHRLPFSADTPAAMIFQHVYQQPTPPQEVRPDLPIEVVRVISKAIAKNPADRFSSAVEMADAFNDAIRGRPVKLIDPEESVRTYVGVQGVPTGQPPSVSAPHPGARSGDVRVPTQALPAPVFPETRRSPLPLIMGGLVVLGVIGGGLFLAFGPKPPPSPTPTLAVLVQPTQTSTATALPTTAAPPSATNTTAPTNSPVPTHTSTNTAVPTATNTPRPSSTNTPRPTNTTPPTATPVPATTAAPRVGVSASLTAFAIQQSTKNPLNNGTTPTRVTINVTPSVRIVGKTGDAASIGFNGTPEEVVKWLEESGDLDSTDGSLITSADKVDVLVDKAGFDQWEAFTSTKGLANFVMLARFSWDAADTGNGCGFIFRYTAAAGGKGATFYRLILTRDGKYQVGVKDEAAFRKTPLDEGPLGAMNSQNGATNQVLLIGTGDTFRFYVNGEYIGDFTDDTYDSGQTGVLGSRPTSSSGLLCRFRNIWVWESK